MYTRKTVDEFDIMANYGGGWETVCTESTFKEAKAQKKCYLENDPRDYRIVKRRVKIEQPVK
jgi:hypothetical protein